MLLTMLVKWSPCPLCVVSHFLDPLVSDPPTDGAFKNINSLKWQSYMLHVCPSCPTGRLITEWPLKRHHTSHCSRALYLSSMIYTSYIRRMYTKECIYLENYSVYIIGMSSYYLYFMKVIQYNVSVSWILQYLEFIYARTSY